MAQVAIAYAPRTDREAAPVVSFAEARHLAAEYGSPLMVLSRSALIRNCQELQANLPGVELYYAAKANPAVEILEILREQGCSVDVCSFGETKSALRAGYRPDEMLHTHPCKTQRNLVDCYEAGIRLFVYDCVNELPKMAKFAPDASLLLRIAASGASSLIDLSSKFGAAPDEALGLLLQARRYGMHVRGLSFHVGSQCVSPDDFRFALGEARRVWEQAAKAGVELELLDIGGGFPAPYRQSILSTEEYCASLMAALGENFGDLNIRVIAEPGRGLCAEPVTLITSVIGKTTRKGREWYFLDDGLYGAFSGKVYDHADFPLIAEAMDERDLYPCVVAGPTCDSTDVVSRDQHLPKLEAGELLLVPSMGAYTSVSASGFNGMDIAPLVVVD